MKLNTEKIKQELKRINKTQTWLADELGVTRQRVYQIINFGSIKNAERIGKIFKINAKDLIK